jgi:hypothetical protein
MKRPAKTTITLVYESFVREMAKLDKARLCDCELPGLAFFIGDAVHHLCAVLGDLEKIERGAPQQPHAAFAAITDVQAMLAREAYLSVLAIGQALRREDGMAFTNPTALVRGQTAVGCMLDALAPYVSKSETHLRRIVLDGVDPEVILDEVSDAS